MGFLSRKKKNQQPAEAERLDRAAAVAEETHPIVEELEQMEQAVPERRFDRDSYEEDYVEEEHDEVEEEPHFEEQSQPEEVERPVNAEHQHAAAAEAADLEDEADEEDD